MSDKPNSNEQIEAVKRYASELVDDMKSRNLLLPAIALVVFIVAAMLILPNRSEPVVDATPPATPAPAQPIANATPEPIEITLITPTAVGSSGPLNNQRNPFMGKTGYTCTTVSTGPPRVLDCDISGLKVRVTCPMDATDPPCGAPASAGAASEEGASGETGGATDSTGGGGDDVDIYVYKATVRLDGETFKDLDQGDKVPPTGTAVVTFEAISADGKEAMFRLPAGSIARPGGSYTIETEDPSVIKLTKGRSARITDATGANHTLRLDSISRTKV